MGVEEQREQIIQNIADELRRNPFTFEFRVVKKPKGIKVIYEVSAEDMDAMCRQGIENHQEL